MRWQRDYLDKKFPNHSGLVMELVGRLKPEKGIVILVDGDWPKVALRIEEMGDGFWDEFRKAIDVGDDRARAILLLRFDFLKEAASFVPAGIEERVRAPSPYWLFAWIRQGLSWPFRRLL